MLVKYWMRKAAITVRVDDSMQDAIGRMREYHVPLLPVMDGVELVGVITDRDLKKASASEATSLEVHELAYLISKIKARNIMAKPAITVQPDYTLEEASAVLLNHNISGAPVVDAKGRIMGTISQKDIFRALISLTGLEKRGVQFAMEVLDRPGSIKEVTDVIRQFGSRLISLMTSYERARSGHRRLYVRAFSVDRQKMPQLVNALREKADLLYLVDHAQNLRVEYPDLERVA